MLFSKFQGDWVAFVGKANVSRTQPPADPLAGPKLLSIPVSNLRPSIWYRIAQTIAAGEGMRFNLDPKTWALWSAAMLWAILHTYFILAVSKNCL